MYLFDINKKSFFMNSKENIILSEASSPPVKARKRAAFNSLQSSQDLEPHGKKVNIFVDINRQGRYDECEK
jgi:hypothetical protein